MSAVTKQITRWGSVVAGIALLAMSAPAAADEIPQTMGTMEFKFGPYMPRVDDAFDGVGPYEAFYGDSSMRYGEFTLDYHLWQGIGKLSLGGHLGYGRVRASVRDESGNTLDVDERTSFRIIPLRGSLIYRFDYGALRYSVPLVPVVKGGLNYNFWRAKTPSGDTANVGGQRGSGGKMGWHATLGIHLHLNFFDRSSAAAFDMSWGIANSYLFYEHTWNRVGDFGEEGGLELSANHWALGLAFEF